MLLCNPLYRPSDTLIAALREDVACDLHGRARTLRSSERTRMAGEIGEQAVAALLAPLQPHHVVTDTNRQLKRNYPGADFLIGQRVRLQVKASPWIQLIGISPKPDPAHVSHAYDI